MPGHRAGYCHFLRRKRLRRRGRADRLVAVRSTQLDAYFLSRAKILLLTIGSNASGAAIDAHFHLAVFDGFDVGVACQRQLGAVDIETDPTAIRGRDHQTIERDFLTDDLSQVTGKVKRFEAFARAALIIKSRIAEHHHRNGLTGKRAWQIGDNFEYCNSPFIPVQIQGRCGQAVQMVHSHHVASF